MRVSRSSGGKTAVNESCETLMLIAETDEERRDLALFGRIIADGRLGLVLEVYNIGAHIVLETERSMSQ